jgi:hypothetical protein
MTDQLDAGVLERLEVYAAEADKNSKFGPGKLTGFFKRQAADIRIAVRALREAARPEPQPAANDAAPFVVGARVRPRDATLEGELLEFNADATGALIRWDTGDEVWKALRTLEVVSARAPQPAEGEALRPPTGDFRSDLDFRLEVAGLVEPRSRRKMARPATVKHALQRADWIIKAVRERFASVAVPSPTQGDEGALREAWDDTVLIPMARAYHERRREHHPGWQTFDEACKTVGWLTEQCDLIRAALTRPTPPDRGDEAALEAQETGWLIKRSGQYYAASPHSRWTIQQAVESIWTENWTWDASEALRFARKCDAETLIHLDGWQGATAIEHAFLAARSPSTGEAE